VHRILVVKGLGATMAMPTRWQSMLDASAAEACLAVKLYNDPAQARSFEAFIVHMHLAWLYLLQAEMTRDRVDDRYPDSRHPRRFIKVDGEYKRWELAKAVTHRWPDPRDPVRANLEFFIALRNKIEHRYARQQENMALALGGHSQALLLNYEEETTAQYGPKYSLATQLRIPVFIGTFTPEGETALRRLKATLPKGLARFITDYQSGLDPSTGEDRRFEFRMRVTLELAKKDPEATAMQFSRLDDLTPEQREAVEEMGNTGRVIVREQQRGVVNLGYLKPGQVVEQVAASIPFVFKQDHFVQAWRNLDVRPPTNATRPDRTTEKYCFYDKTHGDYVYTPAYVKHLSSLCATAEGFVQATGRPARTRHNTKAELQAS
jgi:hypothetical protein